MQEYTVIAVIALIGFGVFRPENAHVNDFIAGFSMGLCASRSGGYFYG
jgi:hypothetical protein